MGKVLIFLLIIVSQNILNVQSDSGYVTLWTPKFVQEDAPYQLFILPTDLHQKTEVAVQFRQSSAAVNLIDGKISTIEYPSRQRYFGSVKAFDLTMTLYRNISTVSGTQLHCSSKNVSISTATGNFYNFIQTDKPIYKPGDLVQLRILTIDKDLKPFHRNLIQVNITDPFDRKIEYFEDQEGRFSGVFEQNFTLSAKTVLGDWKITVIVDNKTQFKTWKTFAVQKYVLPLFDVHIDIPEKHVLQHDEISMSIYGKYSFGDFVTGNAEIIIRNPENGIEYLNTVINGIKAPHQVSYNLNSLGVRTTDEMKIDVFVKFTERESKISSNKTSTFYAHHSEQYKMIVSHTEKFLPGFPFVTKIFINNWKGMPVREHFEKISLSYVYKLQNGTEGDWAVLGDIQDGLYTNEYLIPNEYTKLTVVAQFLNCKPYEKVIEMGSVNVGINSLFVQHSPEQPKLNDQVKIFVTSDTELKNILMAIVTRFGIIENRMISCNQQKMCEFEVKVSEKMMPHSTIMVYDVKGKSVIYQGQTKIVTEDLGRNELTFEIPTEPVRTKHDVTMKFESKPRSSIYVLAFDKRLKSLRDGNDFNKEDVVKSLADYDGENRILVNDMSSWSLCTPQEITRVEKGRSYIVKQSGNRFVSREPEERSNDDGWDEEETPVTEEDKTTDGPLREYFPETWIFETLQTGRDKSIEKVFTTPDAITSWIVSAFSVHKDAGIALAPPKELIVKNEFFVKMELPYSIRYKEVLKLKVLVFNYVNTKEEVKVQLNLLNIDGKQFEFVEYDNCKPTYATEENSIASANLKIPHGEVKTVIFYIRSRQTSTKNLLVDENIKIRVQAKGTDNSGNRYEDRVQKLLKIEPVGIKTYSIVSNSYKLDYGNIIKPSSYIKQTNYSGDLSNIDVLINGDFLSKSFDLEKIRWFSAWCLEQKSSTLKRHVNTYRYLKYLNREIPTNKASELYQTVLSALKDGYDYTDRPWFRAYLANTLGVAMESGILSKDMNVLIEHLNKVEEQQDSNGTFYNFNFYYGYPDYNTDPALYTASLRYFAAAYCMVPFVRHRAMLGTRYDQFIERGIRFLKNPVNLIESYSYGWSVAAYVFALNGDKSEAKKLLLKLESVKLQRNNEKCYKLFDTDKDCQIRHTSFAALALIQLNMLAEAEPIIRWLISHDQTDALSIGGNAILTEPIAEMAMRVKTNDTNLNIVVKNEHDFTKQVVIKEFNSHIQQSVTLPAYSENVFYEIGGKGYCTITMLFEIIVNAKLSVPQFELKTSSRVYPNWSNYRILEVCGKFVSNSDKINLLVNVVYEIDIPSGYTFDYVQDASKHTEIKHIDPKKDGTLVHLYYDNYKANINYCVEVVAKREFIVNEAADAGVKIYDFYAKEKAAIEFYRFDSSEC